MMKNAINWFEIPVTDFERAQKFYSALFNTEVKEMDMPEGRYGVLPYDQEGGGTGGGIIQHPNNGKPTHDGPTIYLNGGDDLSDPLSRVQGAGGTVIMPKTPIGPNGFMAQFIDTEGNRLALHSDK